MEKVIKIDLHNKYDLIDKYNEERISPQMLEYIIKQALLAKKNEKIKIIINNKCQIEKQCKELIIVGLDEKYQRSLEERDTNNKKQAFFFVLGLIFIFLSTLIEEETIWKEILVITGWVPIWEMIEVELFPDAAGREERRVIEKILHGEIIETKEALEE